MNDDVAVEAKGEEKDDVDGASKKRIKGGTELVLDVAPMLARAVRHPRSPEQWDEMVDAR